MDRDRDEAKEIGHRLQRYRNDLGWNLSKLAEEAGMSKGYVWAIENGEVPRPSGRKLYDLAKALGVTMSDLLGRELLSEPHSSIPVSLREFAAERQLPEADVEMLAGIQFRGGQPQTKERWALIYSTIRDSEWIDDAASASNRPAPPRTADSRKASTRGSRTAAKRTGPARSLPARAASTPATAGRRKPRAAQATASGKGKIRKKSPGTGR
jgi:transcriptional regulator with XRE-family HTH domain